MLRQGEFLDPVPSLDPAVEDHVIASFASPAINLLWNQQRVIVMKVTRSTLGAGIDPCAGDNIVPRDQKFCAGDNVFILRRFPKFREGNFPQTLNDIRLFELPGASNLNEFGGLKLGEIAEAAVRNQRAHGLFGTPKSSDLINPADGTDLESGSRANSLFFNFPVCRINSFEFSDAEIGPCTIASGNVSRSILLALEYADIIPGSSMQDALYDGLRLPQCKDCW